MGNLALVPRPVDQACACVVQRERKKRRVTKSVCNSDTAEKKTSLAVGVDRELIAPDPDRPRGLQVARAELLARLLVLLLQLGFRLYMKRLHRYDMQSMRTLQRHASKRSEQL